MPVIDFRQIYVDSSISSLSPVQWSEGWKVQSESILFENNLHSWYSILFEACSRYTPV